MDNNNDLTDETIRKIARNQADKILEWTREPGCINTNTGKLWTPEELSTYWKECYAKEVLYLSDLYLNQPKRGARTMTKVIGYDGKPYTQGDRVEIHPGTDLWMMGARYGTVRKISLTPEDRVRVEMDKVRGLRSGPADRFRAV